ncbi:hypothetical protein Tco_1123442 [Tanacetum coccineum]|uniref:DUF4219 domain-containing protein n=1 Tax=Tanacetum coccineum TaxID=301880 RepID=A0ABQ5J3D9_9ASTR
MDLGSAQNNVVAKLPMLKQGDYEMWKLRIEQYIQVQDYALWEVIENENSFKPHTRVTTNADESRIPRSSIECSRVVYPQRGWTGESIQSKDWSLN